MCDVTDAAFVTKDLVFRGSIYYPDMGILRNKATFITGESGAGKTALLKMFNQTETQTSGTILFCGSDVNSYCVTDLRKNAVLCGQNVFLFRGTVAENFNEFRRYIRLPSLSDEEMTEFLDLCCAERNLNRECRNMSGGEKARVFLAVHLSLKPIVLMLDEPTSALDGDTAMIVMQNIKSYCIMNEITLIAVSHDRRVVTEVADDVIDLGGRKDGRGTGT